MNWQEIIKTLQAAGWTQVRLSVECGCSQGTISDLSTGKNRRPSHKIGKRLEQLRDAIPVAAAASLIAASFAL